MGRIKGSKSGPGPLRTEPATQFGYILRASAISIVWLSIGLMDIRIL